MLEKDRIDRIRQMREQNSAALNVGGDIKNKIDEDYIARLREQREQRLQQQSQSPQKETTEPKKEGEKKSFFSTAGDFIKELITPSRGFTEEALKNVTPTFRETISGLTKYPAEQLDQILTFGGDVLFGKEADRMRKSGVPEEDVKKYEQAMSEYHQQFAPKTAGEAKVMQRADIATLVSPIAKTGAVSRFTGDAIELAARKGATPKTIDAIIKYEGDLSKIVAETKSQSVIRDVAKLQGIPETEITDDLVRSLQKTKDAGIVSSVFKNYKLGEDGESLNLSQQIAKTQKQSDILPLINDKLPTEQATQLSRILKNVDDEKTVSRILDDYGIEQKPVIPTEPIPVQQMISEAPKPKEFGPDFNADEYFKRKLQDEELARVGTKNTLTDKAKKFASKFMSEAVDSQSVFYNALRNAEKKGYNIPVLEDYRNQQGIVLRASEIAKDFMANNDFERIIQEVDDVGNLDQYLKSKRAIELEAKGIKTGRNISEDLAAVAATHSKYEPFAQRFRDYSHKLLDYAVESGIKSRDEVEKLKAENPSYVPFNRIFSDEEAEILDRTFGQKATAGLGKQTVFQKIKGSEREVENVFSSMREKTLQLFMQGERNKAGRIVSSYVNLPDNPMQLRNLRSAENVERRIELFGELKELGTQKRKLDRLIVTRNRWARRLASELKKLNEQGVKQYLKRGAKEMIDPKVAQLQTKITPERIIDNAPKKIGDIKTSFFNMGKIKKDFGNLDNLANELALRGWSILSKPEYRISAGTKYKFSEKTAQSLMKQIFKNPKVIPQTIERKLITTELSKKETRQLINDMIIKSPEKIDIIKKKIATRDQYLSNILDELTGLKTSLDDVLTKRANIKDEAKLIADAQQRGLTTFSFYKNGIKEIWEIAPEFEKAMKNLDAHELGLIGQILAIPVRIGKAGITGLNLAFILPNIAADQVAAFINADNALAGSPLNIKNFTESLLGLLKQDDLYKKIRREGGSYTSWDYWRNAAVKDIDEIRASRSIGSKVKYTATHPKQWLRHFEDIISKTEELTRAQYARAEYKKQIKNGRTPKEAATLAAKTYREVTTDFMRSGNAAKALNNALLYFNPSVQGARTLLKNLRDKPVKTTAKIVGTVMMPMVYVTAWNLSDEKRREAYIDIPEWEKENNVIFIPPNPTKDENGKWNVIKIKISPEIASLVRPVRRIQESMAGLEPVKYREFAQALFQTTTGQNIESPSQFIGNVIPQAFKPSAEVALNKQFYTGAPVVPEQMEQWDPREQYFTDKTAAGLSRQPTSGTIKRISQVVGLSPIKTEYWINNTFGGISQQIINKVDTIASKVGLIEDNEIGGRGIREDIARRFTKAYGGADVSKMYKEREKKIKELSRMPKGPEQTQAVQEYISSLSADDRKGATFALFNAGISTRGVSTSQDVIDILPVFNRVKELAQSGNAQEANRILASLSAEDIKKFKKAKTSYNRLKTEDAKAAMEDTVELVRELVQNGRKDEAQKIINSLSSEDKEIFAKTKKSLGY